jgi:hypothetical protein
MNWPLATSRFFIATLHQVQSRSGMSAAAVAVDAGSLAGWSLIGRILAKRSGICQ